MYGKRRVVLSPKVVTTTGKKAVSVTGGRTHHPVGFWYEKNGQLYVDLRSAEQWFQHVNSETIALKGMGPRKTQKALREFVMDYWQRTEAMVLAR